MPTCSWPYLAWLLAVVAFCFLLSAFCFLLFAFSNLHFPFPFPVLLFVLVVPSNASNATNATQVTVEERHFSKAASTLHQCVRDWAHEVPTDACSLPLSFVATHLDTHFQKKKPRLIWISTDFAFQFSPGCCPFRLRLRSQGAAERARSYGPLLDELARVLPVTPENINTQRVLVPGSGLGRLVFEGTKAGACRDREPCVC